MHASTHPIDRPDGSEEAFFSAAYAQFGGSSLNSPAHVRRAGRDAGGPRPVAGRPAYVVVAGKMRQSNKSPQQSELTACGDMITVLLLHASIDPAREPGHVLFHALRLLQ